MNMFFLVPKASHSTIYIYIYIYIYMRNNTLSVTLVIL